MTSVNRPTTYSKGFAQSAELGSEKARLLHFFFAIGVLIGVIFRYFSIIGGPLGALGAHFWCPTAARPTKGSPRGANPKIVSLSGTYLGVIFQICFDLLASVFKHRFLLSFGTDFTKWWLYFDTIFFAFSYLSTSLALVVFLFHSKTRFLQFRRHQIYTFSTCFVDFVSGGVFMRVS